MLAPQFLLLWAFVFNDGHIVNSVITTPTKESCITQTHVLWTDFYKNKMDDVSKLTTICRNESNNYDFVNVVCDKKGACNR